MSCVTNEKSSSSISKFHMLIIRSNAASSSKRRASLSSPIFFESESNLLALPCKMASRMEELFRTSNDLNDFSPSTRASRHIFAFVVKQVSDDFAIEPHNKFLPDYRKRAIRCRCVRKAAHGSILSTFAKVVTEKDALNLFSSFLRDIHNLLSIKFPLVKRLL